MAGCTAFSYPTCKPSLKLKTRTAAWKPRCPFARAATPPRCRLRATRRRHPMHSPKTGTRSRATPRGRRPSWAAASPTPPQRGRPTRARCRRSQNDWSTGAPSTWRCVRATASSSARAMTTASRRARAFVGRSTSAFCAPLPSRERGTRRRRHAARRRMWHPAHRCLRGIHSASAKTRAWTRESWPLATPSVATAARCNSGC